MSALLSAFSLICEDSCSVYEKHTGYKNISKYNAWKVKVFASKLCLY